MFTSALSLIREVRQDVRAAKNVLVTLGGAPEVRPREQAPKALRLAGDGSGMHRSPERRRLDDKRDERLKS